ncbi:MAG: DUF4280 domain-containing protein [Flavobacteriales bacterium]|jgi:muramidase (phage lysozyme)|nr:DUF4280 domain-containing protein [Flavobacteriales bacterium]
MNNNETEKVKKSGKPNKVGIYPVCQGAMCKCNSAKVPKTLAEFEVMSQETVFLNDKEGKEKKVGTTLDLAVPFAKKIATFSDCKNQPMGFGIFKVCTPNIVEWKKSYEAIKLDNGATALIKESEGVCSFGGKISFETHGQTQTITPAEVAATPPEIAAMLTDNFLSEEEQSKLAAGTFSQKDLASIKVSAIKTTDTQRPKKKTYTYMNERKTIEFKAYFEKKIPTEKEKSGLNWVVYMKENKHYREVDTFVDKGELFKFPYRTQGLYVVEAFTKEKQFNRQAGKGGVIKFVRIDGQRLKKELKIYVGKDERVRVRQNETAKIVAEFAFKNRGGIKPKDIYWEVRDTKGKKVSFKRSNTEAAIEIAPRKGSQTEWLKIFALYGKVKTHDKTLVIGNNYVTAIKTNKNVVSVYQNGEKQSDRHEVSLEVSSFVMNPATAEEQAEVKWTSYQSDETMNKEHIIGNGASICQIIDKESEWYFEAFVEKPQGAKKPTSKLIKAIYPKITKAYWADKNGNAISKSGYGHQVYIHLETHGLQGEKFQLKVWEAQRGKHSYIENAGTEIEIKEINGVVNQAFTIPNDKKAGIMEYFQYEFFFTIEKLDYPVLGTQKEERAGNQYLLVPDEKKVRYLFVDAREQITSLKIYENTGEPHLGIVKYGDTVSFKINTRNLVGQKLEFEIWKDIKEDNHTDEYSFYDTLDDKNMNASLTIEIDKEGNGETSFTIPKNWEDQHKILSRRPCYYYLKEKNSGEEFPRAYYIANPNKTEEENKKNSKRIRALMLKIAKDDIRSGEAEYDNAVVLGEEMEMMMRENKVCKCEARLRAYMRMLRIGEGTGELKPTIDKKTKKIIYVTKDPQIGYTTAFGGNKIADLSKHPEKVYSGSSAAGAYQVMRYTWWEFSGFEVKRKRKTGVYKKSKDLLKKYGIKDYSPASQDMICVLLMKHHPGCQLFLNYIIKGEIEKGTRQCGSRIWASLPEKGDSSRYKFKGKPQPATPMKVVLEHFEEFYNQELQGTSNLHLEEGFLKKFMVPCKCKTKSGTNGEVCKSCNKKHIDLGDSTKWITQQPNKCWHACVKILLNYGLPSGSGWKSGAIQMVQEIGGLLKVKDSQAGLLYLDTQLEKGNPVLVGVDHTLGLARNEKTTDHFVVIIGRGCENGNVYYTFYEVGTQWINKGTSNENRLRLKDNGTLIGSPIYSPNKTYTVSQVRKNK